MNSKKTFYILIGVIVILSLSAIGVLITSTILLKRQSQELSEVKIERHLLDEQQDLLTQANRDILEYAELEQIAKSVVPQDKDQAKAVREIVGIADFVGISIRSISFPTSNLGTRQSSSTRSTDTNEEPTAEKGQTSTPSSPPISQAKPVDGAPGIYSLEMTIVPDTNAQPVTYYQFLDFLERLENNRRTAQVTRVKISPVNAAGDNPYVDFSLTINIFVKP